MVADLQQVLVVSMSGPPCKEAGSYSLLVPLFIPAGDRTMGDTQKGSLHQESLMRAELHLCPSRKVTGDSFQDHKQELEK